ncbi:MAG: hypothetical protein O7B81_17165 [Gammaproteobacteria bacterium]|nr:hypothetical protein [Gammaproteobacteria bacterium]
MFANVQTPAFENTARSPQRYAGGHGTSVRTSGPSGGDAAPAANGKPISCLTLRRGPQLMVVFHGCPHPSVVQSLRQAQVMIGLALSPNDLKTVSRLDSYSYVLVSSRSHAKSALAQAVSELIGANWSIDDTTPLPSPDTGVGCSMAWLNTQPKTDLQSLGTP